MRKRKALAIVKAFLSDFFVLKVPIMIAEFRFYALKLQGYFRSFIQITDVSTSTNVVTIYYYSEHVELLSILQARIKALTVLWIELEKHFKLNLIPYLQEKAELRRMKHLKKRLQDVSHDSWKVRALSFLLLLSYSCIIFIPCTGGSS